MAAIPTRISRNSPKANADHPDPQDRRPRPRSFQSRATLWNPAGASFEAACERAGVRSGTVAIIGGPDVFEMFMDRYDTFWLSLAPRVKLPGGEPCFPGVPARSPGEVLAAHGLDAGETGSWTPRRRQRDAVAAQELDISIGRLRCLRRAAVAGDDEQRADDRQIFQRFDQHLAVRRRWLIPEVVKIESRGGHKEDQ